MGLSEDQKAMLRLLAQREQGYEDIAALMGLSVAEVRERVADALAQLDAEKTEASRPAGPVAAGNPPSPPVAKASSGMGPPTAPPAGETPSDIASSEPQASEPQPPAEEQPKPERPVEKRAPASRPQISLPSGQGARAAIAAAAAVLVIVVVVLIVGGGGDDGSSTTSSSSGGGTTSESQDASTAGQGEVTKAVLEPVGGGDGSGVAIFGRVKNSLALQIEAEGLEPTAKGHSYAVWLAQSPQKMLPLAATEVGGDGRIGAQFEVPTEVLAYLANETFRRIVLTETDDARLKASLDKATNEEKAPAYTGTPVLEGTVTGPIVGAAKRKQQQ